MEFVIVKRKSRYIPFCDGVAIDHDGDAIPSYLEPVSMKTMDEAHAAIERHKHNIGMVEVMWSESYVSE